MISSLSIYDLTDKIPRKSIQFTSVQFSNTNYYHIFTNFSLFYFTLSHFFYFPHTNWKIFIFIEIIRFEYKLVHVVILDCVVMLIVYSDCFSFYMFGANVAWEMSVSDSAGYKMRVCFYSCDLSLTEVYVEMKNIFWFIFSYNKINILLFVICCIFILLYFLIKYTCSVYI